jgi:uncharacterized protein YecE (DUF72 family)
MRLSVGTSGFSYAQWKGNFYPDKLPAKEMLAYYATQLSAVEINNTFYQAPKESILSSWAAQVPESFRFSLKASRRITHFKRLKEAGEESHYFLNAASTLGHRLGVVLFQLPPNLRKDLERLRIFVDGLPAGTRAAFEFRHESWLEEPVFEILRAKNCALCVADTDETEGHIVSTADWGYLRLRKPEYAGDALRTWAENVLAQDWREAFVFFKHEDAGAGPKMAGQFLALAAKG